MAKKKYQVGGVRVEPTVQPVNQDTINNDKLRQMREMQEKGPVAPEQTARPGFFAPGEKAGRKGRTTITRVKF